MPSIAQSKMCSFASARLAVHIHMHRSVDKQELDTLLFHGASLVHHLWGPVYLDKKSNQRIISTGQDVNHFAQC
jgi:hypothetical protein